MNNAHKPLLLLKPVYNQKIALMLQLFIQIFLTIWCTAMIGSIIAGIINTESLIPHFLVAVLVFFSIPYMLCKWQKNNYAKTEYRIYQDKLEYEGGYFTINRKEIFLDKVKEITLRKGILQKKHGLGSIHVATDVTGGNSGLDINDIENSEKIYEFLQELMANNRKTV